MKDKILCACGGKCEGICRDKHLKRKRFWGGVKCIAAYTEDKKGDKNDR